MYALLYAFARQDVALLFAAIWCYELTRPVRVAVWYTYNRI